MCVLLLFLIFKIKYIRYVRTFSSCLQIILFSLLCAKGNLLRSLKKKKERKNKKENEKRERKEEITARRRPRGRNYRILQVRH